MFFCHFFCRYILGGFLLLLLSDIIDKAELFVNSFAAYDLVLIMDYTMRS